MFDSTDIVLPSDLRLPEAICLLHSVALWGCPGSQFLRSSFLYFAVKLSNSSVSYLTYALWRPMQLPNLILLYTNRLNNLKYVHAYSVNILESSYLKYILKIYWLENISRWINFQIMLVLNATSCDFSNATCI